MGIRNEQIIGSDSLITTSLLVFFIHFIFLKYCKFGGKYSELLTQITFKYNKSPPKKYLVVDLILPINLQKKKQEIVLKS